MHFKVTSTCRLSARGACRGRISVANDHSPSLSVSNLSIKQLHDIPPPHSLHLNENAISPSKGTHCMETYRYASVMERVMRGDDRVPGPWVHLPHTAGQVSGTIREDEDELSSKRILKSCPAAPPPSHSPRCVADLQVMAFFSFIPLSLKED